MIIEGWVFFIILLLISFIFPVVVCKYSYKKVLIVLFSVIGMISFTIYTYMTNDFFRYGIKMIVAQEKFHDYWDEEGAKYVIPLPSKTVFAFRTSGTSSVYITKTSYKDIIEFYENLADLNILISKGYNNEWMIFNFSYKDESIIIEIKPDNKRFLLSIDVEVKNDVY